MIKDTILQHKIEKEKILSESYILREKLDFAKNFLNQDLIKVIMGPRRSGKSVFSFLLLKNKNFAYLNFDDENLLKIENNDDIIKSILDVYSKPDFILFDEIQNLKNWELFVNKLKRRGFNLILTGSNSKLLSKEFGTALTGRYIPIKIFPFSFKEFLTAKKVELDEKYMEIPETRGKILNYLDEYLNNGGFPEIVTKNIDPKVYLGTLFDSILLTDIVKRHSVKLTQKLYDLSSYMISTFSSEFSFASLRKNLDFNSTNTVQIYIKYLEESYLMFTLNRFDFKIKKQIKTKKKCYIVDNGFIHAKSFQFSQNTGKLMENLVFNEILRKDYKLNQDIFYYKTRNDKEIDFVLKKAITLETLIQVCYDIDDPKTYKRETDALIEASEELNCDDLLIITWDNEKRENIKGKKINFIPLWKWLLKI
ncbi:ATP-binding protein [Patescibacteria group bacterium]|nr:ATP-binding protein [Patescibacteria group bacterium]